MTRQVTSRGRGHLAATLALLTALSMAGCGDILEVNDPNIITPGDLIGEAGLTALRNGALSSFQQAWSGEPNIVIVSGMLTDEWMDAGSLGSLPVDGRQIDREHWFERGLFYGLQRARTDLERTAAQIELSVSDADTDERIPELLAYAGLTYVAIAENYCSGVPFSESTDALVYGDPLTTPQIFARAMTRFDAALDHPAAVTDIEYLASLGKARALLGLDRATDAAALVAGIADDWVVYNYHSGAELHTLNGIYLNNGQAGRWSLADNEGGNGLPFRSSGDPRVPWTDLGIGFDAETPLYRFDVYQDRSDRFPLASGVEARLIEAEAALQSGGDWLTVLNDLRADFATLGPLLYPDHPPSGTLAPLSDPGSAAAREDLLFAERAYWLFSTGHRLGDLRRLVRQYGRDAESVFPTGPYRSRLSYGTDVNLPVPVTEDNNPNFSGCLDRNP